MIKKKESIKCDLPVSYYSLGPSDAKRAFLLLHGYQHNARKALLDLECIFPENSLIVAPDAPFPVPRKLHSFANLGLSWCFENPNTKRSLVSSQWALDFLVNFVQLVELTQIPLTVVGFSQGGMVGLPLANYFDNIDSLVGISTLPQHNPITVTRKLKVLGIHGNKDSIFDFNKAKLQYEDLKLKGHHTSFFEIDGLDHYVDDQVRKILIEELKFKT